jgi:hypothetical protein
MENRRESDFSESEKKRRVKIWSLCIYVWGPTQVSSLGGSWLLFTFIDDATRKTWFYCIRQKYDVFYTFKKWKALVENET